MDFILSLFSIVLIDLVLSGDNAAVIGLAIKNLPENQRKPAAMFGAGGAVLLRIIFTVVATSLIKIPYLNLVGGVLLLWITWNLLNQDESGEQVSSSHQFWTAIGSIILADVSMAFDNIMGVAGAAHGSVRLVIFGLALSIPILVWGSSWLATLMNKYPIIVYLGGAVLGQTSLAMIIHDKGLNLGHLFGAIGTNFICWGFAILILTYGTIKLKLFSFSEKDKAKTPSAK